MKTRLPALFYTLLLALALAGCSSPTTSAISRIDQNRDKYNSYPPEVQQAILSGEAKAGMTPEQVEMSLGKPTQVTYRGDDEIWIYRKGGGSSGSSLLNNTGLSVGTGIGGVGVSTGVPSIGGGRGETPEEEEVLFVKGVVARSDAKR